VPNGSSGSEANSFCNTAAGGGSFTRASVICERKGLSSGGKPRWRNVCSRCSANR
jgi:hypothetical protein